MGVPRYLKFENADWQLDGSAEPGLYPIEAIQRTWHLDKGRPKTVLGVQRWQLPLVPAFAITAHSSQGKTLKAVLLDLNVSKWMHTAFGTVVASRVRSREDVLILRPFPLWLFQRGVSEGPGLLLRKLRGDIDLVAYLQTRWPT
ncbi:anks1b, partial [Symbiodinium pilosum]